jgi:hypothetical protein
MYNNKKKWTKYWSFWHTISYFHVRGHMPVYTNISSITMIYVYKFALGLPNKIETMSLYCHILHMSIVSPIISYDSIICRLWLDKKYSNCMESFIQSLVCSFYKWLNCCFNTFSFLKPFWVSVNIILLDKKCFNLLNINFSNNFKKIHETDIVYI